MSDDITTPITFTRTDILSALRDAWGVTIPPIKEDCSGFESESLGDRVGDAIVHSILEDFMPAEAVTPDSVRGMIGVLEQLTGDLERVTAKLCDVLEGADEADTPSGDHSSDPPLFAGQGGATG